VIRMTFGASDGAISISRVGVVEPVELEEVEEEELLQLPRPSGALRSSAPHSAGTLTSGDGWSIASHGPPSALGRR